MLVVALQGAREDPEDLILLAFKLHFTKQHFIFKK